MRAPANDALPEGWLRSLSHHILSLVGLGAGGAVDIFIRNV
jgi:hypothetical protein